MGMFKCKDCDNYMLCEYYHNRKETSKICSEFVKDAIPKSDYEARLKADMVAMLEVIKLRIDNLPEPLNRDRVNYCIQQKINELGK